MGDMRDLIGQHGAANTSMFGPALHAGLEKRAINDQLTAAIEQVEQARLPVGPVELVLFLHRQPRHPSTLGSERITGVRQGFLLHQELLTRSLPLLWRHYFRYLFLFVHVFLLIHFRSVFLMSLFVCSSFAIR